MEPRPSRMFELLRECGALARLAPELDALWQRERARPEAAGASAGARLLRAIDHSATRSAALEVRFACLCHPLDADAGHAPQRPCAQTLALSQRWRVDHDCRELALLTVRELPGMQRSAEIDADTSLDLLERCDALRRPSRFEQLLQVCEHIAAAQGGERTGPPRERLLRALGAARQVNAAALGAGIPAGPALGAAIRRARLQAIAQAFARA
jgi:tRNA nucleotidyltransferase (CCA-adding enzyme)